MTKIEAKPAIADLKELFSNSPDGLREIVRAVMQEVLEAEMTDGLGAEKGERRTARLGYRSGYYTRTLVTRVGKLELRVPQDRDGRFSTELFERYQRSEQALVATLAEMYVQGVSTRKVKAITEELCGQGLSGILCARPVASSRLNEPFVEHDGELGLCLEPLARRHFPLSSRLAQDEKQELRRGVIGGQMTSRAHGAA